eukprot:985252_1
MVTLVLIHQQLATTCSLTLIMGCIQSQQALDHLKATIRASFPCKNYLDCHQLKRLREILEYYTVWASRSKEKPSPTIGIFEFIHKENVMKSTDHYSLHLLLSDYHHLIDKHRDDFEDIYEAFFAPQSCDMHTCPMISRNHRDRSNETNYSMLRSRLYFNSKDNNEVIAQQFLDQMHCFTHHTFDLGFKLSRKQIEMQDDTDEAEEDDAKQRALISPNPTVHKEHRQRERISRIIQARKKQIRETTNHKFMTEMAVEKQSEIKPNTTDSMFSFGVRFYYNRGKYADNHALDVEYNYGYKYCDWFIAARHSNLKEELLKNTTYALNKHQYNDLIYKAKYYLRADHITKEKDRTMKLQHVLSIMIYCNFDRLQCELTKTYRHTVNESDTELKVRHSEFGHLGRTLQETVELNGTRVQKGATKTFYHGINVELMFTSTLHKFCGPISTSSEYAVALLFTKKNGIVLELNDGTLLSDESESIYFDCQYVSDFAYEKEKLFLGGMFPLKIVGLFHVKLNENYGAYIKLITILLSIIEGDIFTSNAKDEGDLSERNQEAIVRLLKHELGDVILQHLPDYISRLWHHICLNIELITTRFSATFGSRVNKKQYHILGEFLCSKECTLFRLDLLNRLFPNLTSIALECTTLTHKVFDTIVQFLSQHKPNDEGISSTNLTSIVFQSPTSPSLSCEEIQEAYEVTFSAFDWSIKLESMSEHKRIILKKNKTSDEDRKVSTNVLNSDIIFQKMEELVLQRGLSLLHDNDNSGDFLYPYYASKKHTHRKRKTRTKA